MGERASTARISVVIVSWNSGDDLLGCVASLAAARSSAVNAGIGVELVVVDNASADFPRLRLQSLWSDVKLLLNDENHGFGPAANQGAALASGEFVVFLNPDTRAVGEPFGPLLEAFASDTKVVAVAPRLLDGPDEAGEDQERFQLRHLPSWGQALRELLLIDRLMPGNRGLSRDRYLDRDRDRPFAVEQPAAAALAVRRSVFAAAGGFDGRFLPAWFEDVDLCARLLPRGTILYWPASRFVHAGRAALTRLGYDRFLPVYYRNAIRYWCKHRGRASALAFRLLVVTGMLLRLALLPLRTAVPRPRREATRAYLRTLATAVRSTS